MELGKNRTAIALGRLIAEQRKHTDPPLTQATLAARLGVTPGAVAQWESGRTLPTTRRQMEIVKVLGIPWNKIEAIYREAA